PSLVVTIPGQDDQERVWVMAHMDVVPTGEISLWETDPFKMTEKDGILYGRGVEDNQQGLVSGVFAALYYLKNNIKPAHTIKLLFVADEENGSQYGIIYLLEHHDLFKKTDLILIPDGGDPEGKTIEIAEKNLLWLKVKVSGRQTHGSRPDTGSNACLAACALSLRIHELENIFNERDDLFEPNYSTFQPTKREKNVDSVNIIPGEDIFYMDCRILPCYSLNKVIAKIKEIVFEIEASYDVKVEISYPQKSESPATSPDSPVARKLASSIKKVHGIDAEFIGIGGGTVGAELRRKGLDAVVWSTLDDQAHQPNEYCKLENLIKDSETLIDLFA
nr:M20 family metallo-hydrolase [Treponemataceae bacterium]